MFYRELSLFCRGVVSPCRGFHCFAVSRLCFAVVDFFSPWCQSLSRVSSCSRDTVPEGHWEFKKLRRLLQRKRQIKIELCVRLSILRLFHVDHVVQNRRTTLSLAWYEWLSCKGRVKDLLLRARVVKYENFTSSFGRLRQHTAPKSVQHDYFSSFNQPNHWLWRSCWRCRRQILNSQRLPTVVFWSLLRDGDGVTTLLTAILPSSPYLRRKSVKMGKFRRGENKLC